MALGNLFGTGFNAGKLLNTGYKVAVVVGVAIVVLVIVWIIIYVLKFNKKILLLKEVNGQIRFAKDKGHRDKKNREFKALKHRNLEFAYPTSNAEYPFGRGTVIPFIVRNQQAVPIKGVSANPKFIPADLNMFSHLVGRIKMNEELARGKETFWDKYGRDVLLVTMMTILFISIIFILKRVDKAIEMGRQWTSIANAQSRKVIEGIALYGMMKIRKKQK